MQEGLTQIAAWSAQPLGLSDYLVFSSSLFCIGLYGAIARRNAIAMLMGIELMLNSVNVNLVAISKFLTPSYLAADGQFFALFVITVAAAEAAVGLSIIVAIFRAKRTVNADEINILRA